MGDLLTFLKLADEFGGTKFGPFSAAEIRLGSDPELNDITLPAELGVLPEHMKVLKQKDGSFIIAPTDRSATVFVWRANGSPPKQISTPVAVTGEDGFSVVTAEGVRFNIVQEEEKRKKPDANKGKSGLGAAKGRLSVGSMMEEIKRQGIMKFTRTSLGHWFQNGYKYVTSGAILKPRNIIMMITVASGWVFAGGIGCTALSLSKQKADAKDDLESCSDELDICQGVDDGADPTIASLTQEILGDSDWLLVLQGDPALQALYAEELRSVFQQADRYEWVYKRGSSDFAQLSRRLQNALGNDPDAQALARVLPYIAARPGTSTEREWVILRQDSAGRRVCGRSAAAITYRQAHNLGLDAQLDAEVKAQLLASADDSEKRTHLTQTGQNAGLTMEEIDAILSQDEEIESKVVGAQGGSACIWVPGDDSRSDYRDLASGLKDSLAFRGAARDLPRTTDNFWLSARLVKFYAADYEIEFDQLDLKAGTPTQILASLEGHPGAPWVMENTAKTMARAVAIPCLARLHSEGSLPEHLPGEIPSLVKCGILNLLADRDSFTH